MRRSAILFASVCAFVAATPAEARDGAWYVGGDFGAMIVEDVDFDFGIGPTIPSTSFGTLGLNHDYGFDGALFVGYDLGAFRLEAETSYKKASLDTFSVVGGPIASTGTPHPVGTHEGFGSTSALSFMLNGMLDFGDDDGISGFVGGGAGIARINYSELRAFPNSGAFLDDSDSRFAWQLVAGLRTAISDNMDLTLRYRFFNVGGLDLHGVIDQPIDSGRFRSHSVLGGLTFNFGAAPPPPPDEHFPAAPAEYTPPPPPPPPPVRVAPPSPPPAAVIKGPFIVFFDWDSDVLTPQAKAILDNAISAFTQSGEAQIYLAGHADSSGPAAYNDALAQRRALNVFSYLGSRNVPTAAIKTKSFGESDQRVPTADGVREVQNRRVEINFGPGSGW